MEKISRERDGTTKQSSASTEQLFTRVISRVRQLLTQKERDSGLGCDPDRAQSDDISVTETA